MEGLGMMIPEIRDSGMQVVIRKVSMGHSVEISFAGMPVKRYLLANILATFFNIFMDSMPRLGVWILFTNTRRSVLEAVYKGAIAKILTVLQKDIGTTILESE